MNYKLIAYAENFVSFLLDSLGNDSQKVKQIILFGSSARGEATKESDLDLFIDILDKKIETKIKKIENDFYQSIYYKKYWELLGIKNEISCTTGKLEEWDNLKKSILANGLTLFGKYSENITAKPYYLFIVKPTKNRRQNINVWRALYGYTQKIGVKVYVQQGLIRQYEGKKLANGVFIIPLIHAQKISSFLKEKSFNYQVISFQEEMK